MNPIINLSQRDGEVWLLPVMSAWAAQKAPLLSMEEGQDVLGESSRECRGGRLFREQRENMKTLLV